MKYLIAIIGLIVVVILGSFLWSAASDTFSGDSPFFTIPAFEQSFTGANGTSSQPRETTGDTTRAPQPDRSPQPQPQTEEVKEEQTPPPSDREGVVSIGFIQEDSFRNDSEEISFRTNLREGETVNITGWRIKTNESEFTIPQGVEVYQFSDINDPEDIVLESRDRMTVFLDERPIPENLKLNKCTGYLNQIYDLGSLFPERCPEPGREEYRHLSGTCQEVIRGVDRCERPDSEVLNSLGGGENSERCRDFLGDHFNAGSCFERHSDDEDFLSNEWYIWVDEDDVFDDRHDWVRLFNREGKLIDERDY